MLRSDVFHLHSYETIQNKIPLLSVNAFRLFLSNQWETRSFARETRKMSIESQMDHKMRREKCLNFRTSFRGNLPLFSIRNGTLEDFVAIVVSLVSTHVSRRVLRNFKFKC